MQVMHNGFAQAKESSTQKNQPLPRHGLQLWTSLPPSKKMLDPSCKSYHKNSISTIEKNDAQIPVISGTVGGVKGSVKT